MISLDPGNNDRPVSPANEDCCGNACNPCIFDIHKKLIENWEKQKLNKLKYSNRKNFLSLTKYNKCIIKDITEASENFIIISLNCLSENKDEIFLLMPCQHIIMKLATTSKPYTPISWNQRDIKLLIKLYLDGKASSCIRQLKVGDEIFIRGPYGEFKYNQNSYKHIIMFSIGSGIAAIYPLAVSIIKNDLEDTRVNMISGFQSLSHVPLKDELKLLTDYWNFQCTLYLSLNSIATISGIKIVNSRITKKVVDDILNNYSCESSLILVCGTSDFNDSMQKIIIEKNFLHYYIFK